LPENFTVSFVTLMLHIEIIDTSHMRAIFAFISKRRLQPIADLRLGAPIAFYRNNFADPITVRLGFYSMSTGLDSSLSYVASIPV
jgi:hypothetical protein